MFVLVSCIGWVFCLPEAERYIRNELIKYYFELGYAYKDIIGFLCCVHGITLSLSHLKRLLYKLGLKRNRTEAPLLEIAYNIRELHKDGFDIIGYRAMWKILNVMGGTRATQETVRIALNSLTPNQVHDRSRHRLVRRQYRNRGPNYLIHIDGYDKLKPFGIAIHGAIDGYSRKILWLRAANTNKNPRIIARYFMNYVEEMGRVPRVVRADAGTENSMIRDIQVLLRQNHNDSMHGKKSFQYGKSTSNQRIEMLWSFLMKNFTQYWRNLFKDLRDSGHFSDENAQHINCIRFCFLPLVQNHLDIFTRTWNLHRIRRQSNREVPSGVPNVMFYQSEINGDRDYSFELSFSWNAIHNLIDACTQNPPERGCSEEFWDDLEFKSEIPKNEWKNIIPKTKEGALMMFDAMVAMFDI